MGYTEDVFISLLRSAVTETDDRIDFSKVDYELLFTLSKFHDLAHIVFYELRKRIEHWEGDIYKKFRNQYDLAIYRNIKRDLVINKIREIFEKANMQYVLLKGSYLINLYPKAWMRTSSDIDVLIHKEDFPRIITLFCQEGMKRIGEEKNHDCSFLAQEGYHIELHYSLIENFVFEKPASILQNIWQKCSPKNDDSNELLMNDDALYFYHIAHMAKHFKNGGNGVRTILDTWVLNHKIPFDKTSRDDLLISGGLRVFEEKARYLSEIWFSKMEKDTSISEFEQYIISGGIYGTADRKIALQKRKSNNTIDYYCKRIFLPYIKMKYSYPILMRFPILLPFCWIARLFKLSNPEVRKKIKAEINIDETEVDRIQVLMKDLEIW